MDSQYLPPGKRPHEDVSKIDPANRWQTHEE